MKLNNSNYSKEILESIIREHTIMVETLELLNVIWLDYGDGNLYWNNPKGTMSQLWIQSVYDEDFKKMKRKIKSKLRNINEQSSLRN